MSKYIRLTDEMKEQYRAEFAEAFEKAISDEKFDGKISVTKTLGESKDTAEVFFTMYAWTKMNMLLHEFGTEVAWHGVSERMEGVDGVHRYKIYDILVYPQTVSGATVEMDEEKYAKWCFDNREDDRFENIHMQGHSHVNMSTFPSGVDTAHQSDIVRMLPADSFYIFMIYNKRLERWVKIYDNQANLIFENKDVSVKITDSEGFEDFIKEAKAIVQPKTYTYPRSSYPPSGGLGSQKTITGKSTTPNTPTTPSSPYNPVPVKGSLGNASDPENRPKTCIGSGFHGKGSVRDDYDDDYYNDGYGYGYGGYDY